MRMLEPGIKVSWSTHGAGGYKERTGTIVAHVGRMVALDYIARKYGLTVKPGKYKNRVEKGRYLILVPRGGKSVLSDVYAPPDDRVFKIVQEEVATDGGNEDAQSGD